MDVFIEAGAESVNEGDGTDVQACLVHMGRTGTHDHNIKTLHGLQCILSTMTV